MPTPLDWRALLFESVIYKHVAAEVLRRNRDPYRDLNDYMEPPSTFNNQRLLEPERNILPPRSFWSLRQEAHHPKRQPLRRVAVRRVAFRRQALAARVQTQRPIEDSR